MFNDFHQYRIFAGNFLYLPDVTSPLNILFLCLLIYPYSAFTEGTKQVKPFFQAQGELCIDKSRNDFAFYDAAPEFRLNIYIADPSEKICYGFGWINFPEDTTTTMEFRIKDPGGNIVYGPVTIPFTGAGFIDSYDKAVSGPFVSAGGYDPIIYQPSSTGNYCFEFYYPPDDTFGYFETNRKQIRFFDITVEDNSGKAINGRVWSKAWQFNSGILEAPPTTSRFYGKMYILSDDSVVTQLDCNGFVGGTFSISSNSTGCATTGNMLIDRRSTEGFHTYPQYKVFLDDPDSTIFPTRKEVTGIILPVTITTDCTTGSVDFGVKVSQDGMVDILIDVNPSINPDPLDVRLIANVLASPGGNGYNIIHWNGRDNSLTPVPNGTGMEATVSYVSGLTHLPIYDIEYNDKGYKVSQVRPPGPQLKIYWDDTLIPGGTSNAVAGCDDSMGCHTWDSIVGNVNTINSWWYISSGNIPSIPFVLHRIPGKPGPINGPFSICRNSAGNTYTIPSEPNTDEYSWSYSGKGATIHGNGLSITIDFSDSASSGSLNVFGRNQDCGDGAVFSLLITVNPVPTVTLLPFDTVCFSLPTVNLSGGSPAGGYYFVNGDTAVIFQPQNQPIGLNTIIYSYTTQEGCSSSDTSFIYVKNGQECAPMIYFPTAFTPNGDGLNDTFKPVASNIIKFLLEIYNRSGELIFSTTNLMKGWDGTFRGEPCMTGVYVFKSTYQVSTTGDKNKTITGTVTIIR